MTRPADSDDYLWDRSGPADPDVARLEQLLAPLAHTAPLRVPDELAARRRWRRRLPTIVGLAVGVAAVLALVVWWRGARPGESAGCSGGTGFAFTAKGGKVTCGSATVERGVLPIGTTLDTGAHEAELAIATIGKAELGPNTRLRLAHTSEDRHELFLEQGHLHARVSAPPRIFAVATPSAHVTDLGCEYSLDVDASGAGAIHVISGKVELETGKGTVVVAPAGSHARLLPGRRASVPVSDRAGAELVAAVHDFESGASDGLARVLEAARAEDAITIANLVEVVPAVDKRRVLARLAELVPAPQEVTIDEALGDRALWEMWFDEVVLVHAGVSSVPGKR